jgi:hypothetical protein
MPAERQNGLTVYNNYWKLKPFASRLTIRPVFYLRNCDKMAGKSQLGHTVRSSFTIWRPWNKGNNSELISHQKISIVI